MNFNLCIQPCNFYLSQIIQPPSTDILRALHRDHSFPKNAECFVLFTKCSFSFLQRGNPLVGPPIPLLYQSCFFITSTYFLSYLPAQSVLEDPEVLGLFRKKENA